MTIGVIEAIIALLIGISGGIYIIGQMNAHEERNKEDIAGIKKMIVDYQESMKSMMESNISDMRVLFDTNKEHQKDNLEREISHLKDLIALTNNEIREDIKRIEIRQESINKSKEKLVLLTASVKSLHKRLDIEVPPLLDSEE